MTQEVEEPLKDLLIKDLCMRLPYNPMVDYKGESYNVLGITHGRLVLCKPFMSYTLNDCPLVKEVKPYLFPLSSMTDEMWDKEFRGYNITEFTRDSFKWGCETLEFYDHNPGLSSMVEFINRLIKNHFDIYGLIQKGLAIDATNLNIY